MKKLFFVLITFAVSLFASVCYGQAAFHIGFGSAVNPIDCLPDGWITITGFSPGGDYTVHYTASGTPASVVATADAGGICTIPGLGAGNYTDISAVNDAGNTSDIIAGPYFLTTPPALPPLTGIRTICVGTTTILTDGLEIGTWMSSNTGIATVGSTGIVTGVSAGTVMIVYTLPCGFETAIVTVNALPTLTLDPDAAICAGTSIAIAATSGGVSLTWGPNWGLSCTDCAVPVVSPTVTTIYTVTATSAEGCMKSAIVTVSVNPVPAISAGPGVVICNGVSTTLSASGGGSFTWGPNRGLSCTVCPTPVVTPTVTTTYTVTATSAEGCTNAATVAVTVNPLPVAGTITGLSVVNTGSTITLTDVAGSGAWSAGNSHATVSGGVVAGVSAGAVTISYTVTNSCGSVSATKAVTVNATAMPISGTKKVCAGATTALTYPAGGGTWSSSNTAIATVGLTSGMARGVSAGVATITYAISGSRVTTMVTVYPNPSISVSAGAVLCYGGTTALAVSGSGGTAPLIGTGSFTVAAGVHSYTITDAKGCSAAASRTVTQPAAISISGAITNVSCHGGSNGCVTISVSGGTPGYSYLWSTGSHSANLTGRTAGTYTLTVTDTHGCIKTASYTITQPAAMACSITVTPGAGAYTGGVPTTIYLGYGTQTAALTATATGVAGVTYLWSSASGTSNLSNIHTRNPVFTATLPGHYTYAVTITSEGGCTTTCSVSICVIDAVDHKHKGHVLLCHGYGCSPGTLSLLPAEVPSHLPCHATTDHLGPCGSTCAAAKSEEESESPMVTADELTVTAFPNPFTNDVHVKIESNLTDKVTIIVYDILGRVRDTRFDQEAGADITLGQNLASGIFFVEVRQGDQSKKVKVVKY